MSAIEQECQGGCTMEMYSGRCCACGYVFLSSDRETVLINDARQARRCMRDGEHNQLTAWYYKWRQTHAEQDATIENQP